MSEPRILFIDIETAPIVGYVWSLYNTNVIDVKEESYILGYSYAWGDDEVKWAYNTYVGKAWAEEELISGIWDLFDKADIIIAHNGDRFDIKKINFQFAKIGLGPPSPYQSIDTIKVTRKVFGTHSHSLKYLARSFKLDAKFTHSGFSLWLGCMADDHRSWAEMKEYAIQDTETLRQLYYKVRPWITTGPNMGHWVDDQAACRNCASTNLQKRGMRRTNAGAYQSYLCNDCGSWSKGPNKVSGPILR